MTAWLIVAAVALAAFVALRQLGLRGPMLQLGTAALLLGCAGYSLQGSPGTPGAPRAQRGEDEEVLQLTRLRHAFYGSFSGSERWLLMAEALARRGNTADAVGILRSAVREHPGDPHLWVGLGNALVDHTGALTPASEFAYRRAAELSPGYPAPPFFFGIALLRSGDAQSAVALWQEVLARAPADASWRPLVEDVVAVVRNPPPPRRQLPRR